MTGGVGVPSGGFGFRAEEYYEVKGGGPGATAAAWCRGGGAHRGPGQGPGPAPWAPRPRTRGKRWRLPLPGRLRRPGCSWEPPGGPIARDPSANPFLRPESPGNDPLRSPRRGDGGEGRGRGKGDFLEKAGKTSASSPGVHLPFMEPSKRKRPWSPRPEFGRRAQEMHRQ